MNNSQQKVGSLNMV